MLGYLGLTPHPAPRPPGDEAQEATPTPVLTAAPPGAWLSRRALWPLLPRNWLCTKGLGSGLSWDTHMTLAPNMAWGLLTFMSPAGLQVTNKGAPRAKEGSSHPPQAPPKGVRKGGLDALCPAPWEPVFALGIVGSHQETGR